MFAEVIIPLSVGGTFTYLIPDALRSKIRMGSLVLVPFAGNKLYTALVTRLHSIKPEGFVLKSIDSIVEERVVLSERHIAFIEWVADYYGAYPGDVLRAALPVAFRLESVSYVRLNGDLNGATQLNGVDRRVVEALGDGNSYTISELQKLTSVKGVLPAVKSLMDRGIVVLKEVVDPLFKPKCEVWVNFKGEFTDTLWQGLKRATVQRDVVQLFLDKATKSLRRSDIISINPNYAAAIRELCKKEILVLENREVKLEESCNKTEESYPLNQAQLKALNKINTLFGEFDTVLLHGVTSSGKTEIYIKLIEQVIAQGKSVLFMLPEIALTIQIIRRLKRVFGNEVGVYHSGMSDRERAEVWRRQSGDNPYKLLLGVRSSLFLPHNNLGLIIVDEEHDTSYKQREPSPRYNGRDAALMLAKMCGAKSLLGSATPSFESYRNALGKKFGLVELTQRHGNFRMPRVELADLSDARRRKVMCGSFTPILVKEMRRVLGEGGQVILFQDRRGYSTFVRCDKCGHVPQCPACDVSMTYYKGDKRMMCRYCGRIFTIATHCSECCDGTYKMGRAGTERIEEEIATLFPDCTVDRIDTDSMSNKSRFRESIANFESGKTRILVGTRMIAKGLDFGGVKLVGVIDADSLVHLPDFRAEERAFAQLLQVSGRCGRRGDDGVVIIQTSEPQRSIFDWIRRGDYSTMFNELGAERKEFAYPPFTKAIGVELRHKDCNVVREYANSMVKFLRLKLGAGAVEGPAEPDVARIGNMHRVTILLKLTDYNHFKLAKFSLNALSERGDKGIRIIIDVDTY